MTNNIFQSLAAQIVNELGWSHAMRPDGAGVIAFPQSKSIRLQFTTTSGAARAIAVQIVNESGALVAISAEPTWLMSFDLDPAIAARQIRENLVQPFFRSSAMLPAA